MNKLLNNSTKIIDKKTKPRVAYIFNHSYFLGGGEISFYELIRNFDKTEFEPVVIVPENGEIRKKLLDKKIKVHISKLPSLKKFNPFPQFIHFIKLIRRLRDSKIDLLHINGQRACIYGALAARIVGIPSIWHVRETKKDIVIYDIILAYLAKAIIRVSKSEFEKRFYYLKKIITKKNHIVYNGIDTKYFKRDLSIRSEVRSNLGLNGDLLFGIIGNFVPLKGQDFFLKGLATAKMIKPDLQFKCLLIGRQIDRNYYEKLLYIVKQNNLKKDIIFLNFNEDIKKIFSALDVFVLPSKREGFSRSLLEAMSSGLPVIASRISEIEEAVKDRKNAILVEYKNIDRMAKAIIDIYKDKELRNQMGRANRERVKNNFSIYYHVQAIQDIYNKLIYNKKYRQFYQQIQDLS